MFPYPTSSPRRGAARLWLRCGATAPLVLAACSGGSQARGTSSSSGLSSGASATAGDTGAADSTTAAGGTSAATTGTTTGSPKFDVGVFPDIPGGGTGGAVPPSCDTIDMFPDTSVGCVFYTAEVPSAPSNLPYGISVGNPSATPATVTIEDMRGPGGTLREITSFQLLPKESVLTAINGQGGLLPGETHAADAPGLNALAGFRITSDVPVTAMQIFPVGGGPSHVAEASLLLPVNALDTTYLAVGYPHYSGNNSGFIAVVATEDATTVTTSQGDVMLDAFDVWLYNNGADSTGFYLSADKPVAALAGTTCAMIPGLPWYACDHIEEMLVPLATWGTKYVAARHPHRVPDLQPQPGDVYWRVVAAQDNTTVTLTPPVAGNGGQIQLAKVGDMLEFSTPDSFLAESSSPFMLTQYMSGCYNVIQQTADTSNCNQGPTGDPYMIQVVPVEQWLTNLPFLTDTSYPRDFVIIMREKGTSVSLDCLGAITDDHFTPIPGTNYEAGYVDLDINGAGGEGNCVDGAQFLTASAPVGVLVGGVDWATSYGYPGGMSLGSLWTPPPIPPG